jgi:hypothetical protein
MRNPVITLMTTVTNTGISARKGQTGGTGKRDGEEKNRAQWTVTVMIDTGKMMTMIKHEMVDIFSNVDRSLA